MGRCDCHSIAVMTMKQAQDIEPLLSHCWFKVGTPSTTLAQHKTNNGRLARCQRLELWISTWFRCHLNMLNHCTSVLYEDSLSNYCI